MTDSLVQLTKARLPRTPPDALLGPWCATESTSASLPVLSDGATPEDFLGLAERFAELYGSVLDALTAVLNATFGTAKSARYWALQTHPLLYHYVVSFAVKWKVVGRSLGTGSWRSAYALPASRSVPDLYADLRDAYEGDDRFNLELFSLVCRGLGVPGTTPRPSEWVPRSAPGLSRFAWRRGRALYAWGAETWRALGRFGSLPRAAGSVLYKDMDPEFAAALEEATGLRFLPLAAVARLRSRPPLSADVRLRSRAAWSHPDPLVHGILQGLRFHLPLRQVESYPSLRADATRLLDRTGTPGALVFSILERPAFRVFAAEAVERGARVVSVQHGGNYGESLFAVSEQVEREFSDRFVTLGWKNDPVKDVPAGGFRTMRLSPASTPASDGPVLLVAPILQEYPHHANWSPLPRQRCQKELIERLAPEVRRRLVARMRPARAASARLEREWLASFPEVRIDEASEPIGTAMARSSLVVIGYAFSTTLLEAVKMDRPFLVFDQDFESFLTPVARPVYGELREMGLVRSDPAETAAAVAEILQDVNGWWSAPRRRAAVSRYRERFVREADLASWSGLMLELTALGAAP